MTFVLDSRLETSSVQVADLPLCRVRLRTDARYPWLYLVPRREGVRELHDLSAADAQQLMKEVSAASAIVARVFSADKVNVAALGNMVPQLHVHVLARFTGDAAWPRPTWAVQADEIPYDPAELKETIERLQGEFSACPP